MALTTKPTISRTVIDKVSSVTKSFAITPHDTNFLADDNDKPIFTRGIMCTEDGDITVQLAENANGDNLLITATAGVIYPLCVIRVLDTGTDDITIYGLL